jgi:hypothetical protein
MRNRLLIIGFSLLLIVPLILVLTASVHRPIATVLWTLLLLGSRFFRSIPQAFLWMLFLGLVTALAIGSLVRLGSTSPELVEEPPVLPGPVWRMAQTIRRSGEGTYTKWRLARYLAELAAEVFERCGLPLPDLRKQEWALDGVDAPPQVLAYLKAGLIGRSWEPDNPSSWLRSHLGWDRTPGPLDADLQTVVRFLEEQSEVYDDQRHS